MIKILHSADWHLGKKLFRHERLSEQKLFLDWLLERTIKENIDLLLISGDIFDHPIPPNDALSLYYDFLYQISQTQTQVAIISGNHDSGQFLAAPKELLKKDNIFIWGQLEADLNNHHKVFHFKDEDVLVTALPYFRHHEILKHLKKTDCSQDEMENFFKDFFESSKKKKTGNTVYSVLMAHHLFGQYESAGSEQVVSLSGMDSIGRNLYQDYYDYVALGHIHKTQTLHHNPLVIYPGSPIPMRFGESNKKYISEIFIINGEATQSFINVPNHLPLIQIKATENNIYEKLDKLIEESEAYQLGTLLEIKIEMSAPRSGLVDEIKNYLKTSNVMLMSFFAMTNGSHETKKVSDITKFDPQELFEFYYRTKYPDSDLPRELKEDFQSLMSRAQENISNENQTT